MSDPHNSALEQKLSAKTSKKLLVVCSFAWSITAFRGDLIKELKDNGYTVLCAIPEADSEYHKELDAHDIDYVSYPLARAGMNPLKDLQTIFALTKIVKAHQIDLVFPYTIKPVIYGSIAARLNRTPVVALISGLGFTFSRASRKALFLEKLNTFLYRVAMSKSTYLIFQNSDDLTLFKKLGIAKTDANCSYVDGSGINIERFPQRPPAPTDTPVRCLMVARLIREKGVLLYIQAAERLKKDYPDAVFTLVGATESTPSAVEPALIQKYHDQGTIRFTGQLADVGPEYQAADIFVLPSYYREGIPRSILEAMASGLAIVTTDSPGCRETVDKGQNGFLVEPQDVSDLTNKLRELLASSDKVRAMGAASRQLAETRFNVREINRQMVAVFNKVITPAS
jgi:glycosyltransferase involved in cell wall biosynthesis